MPPSRPRVALFATCLVDLHRPTIAFAAIRLLEQAGCQVEVPRAQTCCGQPTYNSGDRATTRDLAAGILDAFGGYDYVVVPSGSCGGMLKHHLPHLFNDDPNDTGIAGVDIYKMNSEGKAVEHWDTLQLVGDPKNSAPWVGPNIPRANANGMF